MKSLVIILQQLLCIYSLYSQGNLLSNFNFSHPSNGWTAVGNFQFNSDFNKCKSCPGYAYLASFSGQPQDNIDGAITQVIEFPPGVTSASLSFWYYITSDEVTTSKKYDELVVRVASSGGHGSTVVKRLSNLDENNGYQKVTINVPSKYLDDEYVGIGFYAENDIGKPTVFRIDDVELEVQTSNPKPDLVPRGVVLDNNVVNPGDDIEVSVDVTNEGAGSATNTKVEFYFSEDDILDEDEDASFGTRNVSSLTANDSENESRTYNVSSNALAGKYYIIVKVDSDNDEDDESNESNNVYAAPFSVNGVQPASLTVEINPAQANSAGAKWKISGETSWLSSGFQAEYLAPGNYTIKFKNVNGWSDLQNESISLNANENKSLTRTYVNDSRDGSVSISISPQEAVDLGAMWRVNGGSWNQSQDLVQNLSPGQYTIEFTSNITGYISPSPIQVIIHSAACAFASGEYQNVLGVPYQLNRNGPSHLFWPFYVANDPNASNPVSGWENQTEGDKTTTWWYTNRSSGHTGAKRYAQDWNHGNNNQDCGMKFYSPITGEVFFEEHGYEESNPPCLKYADNGFGNYIIIRSTTPGREDFYFRVGHFSELNDDLENATSNNPIFVEPGDYIGTIAGWGDIYAHGFGPHAHLDLSFNITSYLARNGYFGGGSVESLSDVKYESMAGDIKFDATLPSSGAPPIATQSVFITNGNWFTLCEGDSIELISTPGSSYLWNTGDTTQSIVVWSEGEYTVSVLSQIGKQLASQTVHVGYISDYTPTILTSNDTSVIQGQDIHLYLESGKDIVWSTGEITDNIKISEPMTVYVTASDPYGCNYRNTASIRITKDSTSGIQEGLVQAKVSVFPNPSNGFFTIESDKAGFIPSELYSLEGKVILAKDDFTYIGNGKYTNNMKLPKGFYVLNLSNGHQIAFVKIVVQ